MCAYCLLQEGSEITGGFQSFQLDHFRPVAVFPILVNDYWNLYYCCHWCNNAKSDTWPDATERKQGFRFVDPCVENFFGKHAQLDSVSGELRFITPAGEFTIREILLNRKVFKDLRRRRAEAQVRIDSIKVRLRQLYTERQPPIELIQSLEERITTLSNFINPKVPYEPEDLLV